MKNEQNKIKLLVGLAVVTLVVGLGWLRYSSNRLEGVQSSADEVPPHWAHSTLPFTIPIINHGSKVWANPISIASDVWSTSGVVKYKVIPAGPLSPCQITPESMNFCTWNEEDGWLHQMMYVQGPGDPHIIATVVAVNDAYLNNPRSEYSTPEWKNYILCQSFGWTMGLSFRVEPPEQSQSCMGMYPNYIDIGTQQAPDETDYNNFKWLYNHDDNTPSTAKSYKVSKANELWQKKQWGSLTATLNEGQTEIYEQQLGDGYKMTTVIGKIITP